MVCPKCGQALPEDSEFCQYCGSKLTGANAPAGNAAPASAPELAGKTCPFCKAPFMEGEAVVFCSHCEMPHHLECWKENGGCTTFGCTGNIGKIIGAEQKNAQSAPVATQRPAVPTSPKTVPYPTSRTNPREVKASLEKTAPKPEPRIDQKPDAIVGENTDRIIQGNIPVLLERTRIQKSADGKLYATCSFVPLTEKRIQAMQVDVQCADIWRERVKSLEGYQYLDLKTSRDTPFGETEKIPLPDSNTRVIDVVIQKIMFADGTLLQQQGKPDMNPNPVPLSQVLNEDLLEEYKAETYQNVRFVPASLGQIWICTCGAVNREEEGDCHLCGDSLASLISHLDKDTLQKNLDEKKRIQREKEERERIAREEALRLKMEKAERERKEREERLRIQREKEAAEAAERERIRKEEEERALAEDIARMKRKRARNKKTAIICSVVALLALVVYLVGWQIIPSSKYRNAEAAIAAGDLELAYSQFSAIPGYRDSHDRAIETRYTQAEIALESKDYDTAYQFFAEITGYSDSETKAKEALYQKAKKLFKEESFAEAQTVFEQIKGYKNSNAQIDLCKRAQQYYEAVAFFEAGKYEEAAKLFEARTYRDSKDRAIESYYLYAKQLIEQNKLHDAYQILSQKVNKGTSFYEDSIELANQTEYQYATECMTAGKYEAAYASFANTKGYEDSDSQYLEAGYQYGLQLFERESYERAAAVFSSLGKYKDSVKQANESKYQLALSLQHSQGKYDKAVKLFTELGNYSDSAKQLKETKYQHALVLQQQKNWTAAEKLFTELGNYSDSAKQLKETKYQHAVSLFNEKKYTQAVPIFKELGNYSDSLEQWKSAMWAYVKAHKNNDDKTTYEYLSLLKKYNYQSSKSVYESLYQWKVTLLAANTISTDYSTILQSVGKNTTYLKFRFKLEGGPPGEKVTLYHRVYWPDGSSWTSNWYWEDESRGSTFTCYWDDGLYLDPRYAKAGDLVVRIYVKGTNELIGQAAIRLT